MHSLAVLSGILALLPAVLGRRCADMQPSSNFLAHSADLSTNLKAQAANITVPFYVHVVTTEAKVGKYPQSMIDAQVALLKNTYSKYGVTLMYISTDYTANNAWATSTYGTQDNFDMKSALRRGGYGDLNHYYMSDLDSMGTEGILGQCYFPVPDGASQPKTVTLDGCVLGAETMPGGADKPYNKGVTAIHETGHWFGLLHPFQNNTCMYNGDLVKDTPFQKTPSVGCMPKKDSCPDRPGTDNYDNFMDYSDDRCNRLFTPDQKIRALNMYDRYRAS